MALPVPVGRRREVVALLPRRLFAVLGGAGSGKASMSVRGAAPAAERVGEVSPLVLSGEPVEFEPRDVVAAEMVDVGAAMHGEAVVETGAAEGVGALRVSLDAVGAGVLS